MAEALVTQALIDEVARVFSTEIPEDIPKRTQVARIMGRRDVLRFLVTLRDREQRDKDDTPIPSMI
jgi:hypothetical protein